MLQSSLQPSPRTTSTPHNPSLPPLPSPPTGGSGTACSLGSRPTQRGSRSRFPLLRITAARFPFRPACHAPCDPIAATRLGAGDAPRLPPPRATVIWQPPPLILCAYPASSRTAGLSRPLRPIGAVAPRGRGRASPRPRRPRASQFPIPGPSRCLHPFGAIAPRGQASRRAYRRSGLRSPESKPGHQSHRDFVPASLLSFGFAPFLLRPPLI